MGYIWVVGENEDKAWTIDSWCGFDPATGKFGPEKPFVGYVILRSGQGRAKRRLEHFPPNIETKKDKAAQAAYWCAAAYFAILFLDHLIP